MGARSFRWDETTGQWVEMSDELPEPMPAPEPEQRAANGDAPARRRRVRTKPRTASMGSFGGMLGGLGGMGGGSGEFEVQPPDELTTFEDVGGMEELKQEVRETVGLMLEHPDDADRYGIEWNGILLHGPPGVGKTFFARAIAGEYGLNLMHVSTGDLIGGIVGQSAQNIDKVFQTALQHLPCLLFFDEFDSVAQRRDGTPDQESRRTVNQLLTSLEAHRDERELLVMAATNSIEHLDPAVIRPGRFDRHIRIDLPDADARRAIFEAELDDRPTASEVDLDELVRRTESMSPAAISKIVDTAALEAFRAATETGDQVLVNTKHLLAAIERYGGQDRPTVEHWSWDSLILDPAIKAQLQPAPARDRRPRVGEAFRSRPTNRPAPRRPAWYREDHGLESARRAGPGVVLSHLRRRRDQQMGRRVRTKHPSAVRARAGKPPLDHLHRRDRRNRWQPRGVPGARQPREPVACRDRRRRWSARSLRDRGNEPSRPTGSCATARRTAVPDDRSRPSERGRPTRNAAPAHRPHADGWSVVRGARAENGRNVPGGPELLPKRPRSPR